MLAVQAPTVKIFHIELYTYEYGSEYPRVIQSIATSMQEAVESIFECHLSDSEKSRYYVNDIVELV